MNYLFELGCEEIPARFLNPLMDLIENRLTDTGGIHQIKPLIQVYATPRRLAVLLSDLPSHTDSREQLVLGPPASVAYLSNGELGPAGQAFLKRNHTDATKLLIRVTDGKERIAIIRLDPPQPIQDILPVMIHSVFDNLPLPVSMNWGQARGPFLRPIQWVVSMLDTRVLPLFASRSTLGSIQLDPDVYKGSLDFSRGHRWRTGDGSGVGAMVVISDASDYLTILKDAFVMVDSNERRSTITNALPIPLDELDDTLLDELVGLCEYPTIISSVIPDEFRTLPDAPVVECIRKNQKYITWMLNGRLHSEYWICVDGLTDQNREQVAKGNDAVLRARLNDVLFFWNEDCRYRLDSRVPKLDQVIYQEGLGSLGHKVKRLQGLVLRLSGAFKLDSTQCQDVKRAAELCKADLLSGMVQELPALQGVMGGLYAANDGETPNVVGAISQLYQLHVPSDPVAVTLWVADRLDTVSSCFANGLIPTGSQDPWGVRRAALGVVTALLSSCPLVSFNDVLGWSQNELEMTSTIHSQLATFYMDRLRHILVNHHGLDQDLVQMVTHRMDRAFGDILALAKRIQEWRESAPLILKRVTELAIRVQRLSVHYTPSEPVDLPDDDVNLVRPILLDLSHSPTLTQIAQWPPIMDAYFEAVMMMDENLRIRSARLGFLNQVSDYFQALGDWEKIVIS